MRTRFIFPIVSGVLVSTPGIEVTDQMVGLMMFRYADYSTMSPVNFISLMIRLEKMSCECHGNRLSQHGHTLFAHVLHQEFLPVGKCFELMSRYMKKTSHLLFVFFAVTFHQKGPGFEESLNFEEVSLFKPTDVFFAFSGLL